ncbi:MAG TPA: carbohydrate kinase family protein [Terriglobales bacterium]|jgi:sugar/nucleoside kinase (ribokinase family)|nr:carbohydrate kinase family protein [Terriglobales bacterium]
MPRFDVTIAGELNLDLILYGLPAELPPDRELLADRMMLTLGGSSSIVAHNLAALGSRVGFQSLIGDDQMGRTALQLLGEIGVDVSRIRQNPGPIKSGMSVILQRDGWRNILTYSGTIAELSFEDLDLAYLADSRHFHLSSYYLQDRLRPHIPELFTKLKAAGLTISMDTNDDPDDLWGSGLRDVLGQLDIFMPNAREACRITGTEDLEDAVNQLAEQVPLVVVKMGHEGAMARQGANRFTSPPAKVTCIDAVGAGDSFDAGFLHQYVRGQDIPSCLAYGNLSGALSTTKPGGTEAFRDRKHREQFLGEFAEAR